MKRNPQPGITMSLDVNKPNSGILTREISKCSVKSQISIASL